MSQPKGTNHYLELCADNRVIYTYAYVCAKLQDAPIELVCLLFPRDGISLPQDNPNPKLRSNLPSRSMPSLSSLSYHGDQSAVISWHYSTARLIDQSLHFRRNGSGLQQLSAVVIVFALFGLRGPCCPYPHVPVRLRFHPETPAQQNSRLGRRSCYCSHALALTLLGTFVTFSSHFEEPSRSLWAARQ